VERAVELRRGEMSGQKSDFAKILIVGRLWHHYPVSAQWVRDPLVMWNFTTVSRTMSFYDGVEGQLAKKKQQMLDSLPLFPFYQP